MNNREQFVEAWLAETGLLPSESVMIQKMRPDGSVILWIEKKSNMIPKDDASKR